MKKLLFFIVIALMISSCTKSQENNWTSIRYQYSSGPLPPPYHYEYEIAINKDCSANMTYKLGYDENTSPLNYSFKIDDDAMSTLCGLIKDSRLLQEKIELVPENQHPIGGPLNRVIIYIVDPDPNLDKPPVVIEAPYFPMKEYAKGFSALYDFIDKLVPQNITDEIAVKKAEFEKK
jgi:hypothetical protein